MGGRGAETAFCFCCSDRRSSNERDISQDGTGPPNRACVVPHVAHCRAAVNSLSNPRLSMKYPWYLPLPQEQCSFPREKAVRALGPKCKSTAPRMED